MIGDSQTSEEVVFKKKDQFSFPGSFRNLLRETVTRPSGVCVCHSYFLANIGSQRPRRPCGPGVLATAEYRKQRK